MRTTTELQDEDGPPHDSARPDLSGPDAAGTFGWLFDQHADALHRYLTRRVGGETADDLLSETFLIALNRRHTYDPTRAAVRTWLYGIATNLIREHVRAELRALVLAARAASTRPAPPPGHDGVVADRVGAQITARRLATALAQLSPGDRDNRRAVSVSIELNNGHHREELLLDPATGQAVERRSTAVTDVDGVKAGDTIYDEIVSEAVVNGIGVQPTR